MNITPGSLAFDIDGVVADTMNLFLDIARVKHNITSVRYEDISCYALEECLDMNPDVLQSIISDLIDGTYAVPLNPMDGVKSVLTRLSGEVKPLLFVTARPYPGPVSNWFEEQFGFGSADIEIISTGSFDAKADILLGRGVTHFVEDRLDTCRLLCERDITPILYKQPWNREAHPFTEVSNWREIESLIAFRRS